MTALGVVAVIAGIGLFVYLAINSPLLYSMTKLAFVAGWGILSVAAPVFFLYRYLSEGSIFLAIIVGAVATFPAIAWYSVAPSAIKNTFSTRSNFALWRPE